MISAPRLKIESLRLKISGDSPLIMNKWSEKAKQQIRDKQFKNARTAKTAKVPEEDYENATYRTADGKFCFPAVAFKAAAVNAAIRSVDGLKGTVVRGAFHIIGEFVEIEGERRMREDMVRVGMGVADLRYRPEFASWSAVLPIRYNAAVISPEQIVNLFNHAGFGVGVGEWRTEKNGSMGQFHVE